MRRVAWRGCALMFCLLACANPASAKTFYGYCLDQDRHNRISEFFSVEADVDGPELRSGYKELPWFKPNDSKVAVHFYWAVDKQFGSHGNTETKVCWGWTDKAKAENQYLEAVKGFKKAFGRADIVPFEAHRTAQPNALPKPEKKETKAAEPSPNPTTNPKKTDAQLTAELAAEKHRAVEERNRAAQAKYEAALAEQKRKVEEYERAKEEVARKKAEQQAAAQAAQDAFKAEQAAYAERLLRHQQEVADQQAKAIAQSGAASSPSPSGGGGRFQATSQIVDTREAAMAGLMSQPVPGPLTDIQCAEVKMYTPPKWTCWGYYYQDRKPAAGSAQ